MNLKSFFKNSLRSFSFKLLLPIVLCSCASSYREVMPNKLQYKDCAETNGLKYCYKHNALGNDGNKKLIKKEIKNGVKLVAVKIENTTSRVILFKRDVKIFMGDELIIPIEPKQMYSHLKQRPASYLWWSLFWVFYIKGNGTSDPPAVYPIPLGAIIGIINMGKASLANEDLMYELTRFNILSTEIKSGETAYGLIGIASDKALPLTFKIDQ